MANTKSAQKRNRQSIKRRARNTSVRTGVKNVLKTAREAIKSAVPTDPKAAAAALQNAARTLHKAATKGVLHPRNAARRIARLSHALAKTAKK